MRDSTLPTCYAYRRNPGSQPVLCIFGDHEIPEGTLIVEPFRGPLVSLCEIHVREASDAWSDLVREEEEKASPALYRERHGIA